MGLNLRPALVPWGIFREQCIIRRVTCLTLPMR